MRAALIPALALVASPAAVAQPASPGAPPDAFPGAPAGPVVSAGPEKVSVTVYRAPHRGEGAINRARPQGFALISETRTIALPAGPAVIRFEGVAGNIFPESAILGGLPGDVREKNLDADLLSPRSLYDRSLGRQVIIRRTNRKTGKVEEEQATIRSSADGAAVLQTADGDEALRCSGFPEKLVYQAVPPGLSPKPTLSIETDSPVARTVTVTLSYLAGGFDWQADYVATMRPDGKSADLFAWVTIASNDVSSFVDASTQVVAGRLNRVDDSPGFGNYGATALHLSCWPDPDYATQRVQYAADSLAAPPAPPAPSAPMMMAREAIVVTAAARKAVQEELGDLKLYRIPDPVTVASKAQKQVAFLDNDAVPLTPVYVSEVRGGGGIDGVRLTLRARNRADQHLGAPLPAGRVAVFEEAEGRPILVGTAPTTDKAVGEDVEFKLGGSVSVAADLTEVEDRGRASRYRLVVTNAGAREVAYEAKFDMSGGARISASGASLSRRDGKQVWAVTIPANGTAMLDYKWTEPRD